MSHTALSPCVPLDMEPEVLADLIEKAKDYALMHGKIFIYTAIL